MEKRLRRSEQQKRQYQEKLKNSITQSTSHVLNELLASDKRHSKLKDERGKRFTHAQKMRYLGYYRRGPKLYKKLLIDIPLALPSVRTLLRTSSLLDFDVGIMDHVLDAAKEELKKLNIKDKICKICYDEISLKVRYHWNRNRDKIIGYEDYANDLPHRKKSSSPCKKALVFMLEGLNRPWKIPITFYFTDGTLKGNDLQILIKKTIEAAEKAGFDIRATVSDQASTNTAAVNALREKDAAKNGLTYFHFGPNKKKIYILFDVPHMLKCIRNNWLGPFTRWLKNNLKDKYQYPGNILSWNGKEGHWRYIVLLYSYLIKGGNKKTFDRMIFPKSRDKMRVKYALKLLSGTTAIKLRSVNFLATLRALKNITEKHIQEAKNTATVVEFINQLGDYTNGPSNRELNGKSKKKAKFLVSETSDHLEKWKIFLDHLANTKFKCWTNEASRESTLENYRWTLKALINLWPDLRHFDGFKTLNLRRLNQDCLENWFGQLRNACGDNDHPTCVGFIDAYGSLFITNHTSDKIEGSNCENDNVPFLIKQETFLKYCQKKKSSGNEQNNTNSSIPIINNNLNEQQQHIDTCPRSPPCFHIPEFNCADDDVIEMLSNSNQFTGYDLAREMLRLINSKCTECTNSCTVKDPVTGLNELSNDLKRSANTAVVVFNDKIVGADKFHLENIHLTTCMLFHETLDMDWIQCKTHGSDLRNMFTERVASLLIERQCVIQNRESVAEASYLSNTKKISQQAKRKSETSLDTSCVEKKLKYDENIAEEISDLDSNDTEKFKKLDNLFLYCDMDSEDY